MVNKVYNIKMQQEKGKNVENDVLTFDEGLERAGHGIFQKKMTVLGGLVIFCSYVSVGGISFILPPSQCDLNMTSYDKGILISAGFVGIILSSHMWGFLSDTMGRRYILMRCIFFDGVLYAVTSLMPSYPLFVCVRFLHGFAACGSVVPIYAYVGEFHTDKHRATSFVIASIIACLANLYQPAISWLIMSESWELRIFSWLVYKPWRLYYALLGIPSLISAASIYRFPESPKFLLAKGETKKAIETLERIHLTNKHETPLNVKNLTMRSDEGITKMEGGRNKVAAFVGLVWNQTTPLFRKAHRFNITCICLIQFLLYLSNNSVFLWLPETINRIGIFVRYNAGRLASFCYIIENFDVESWEEASGNATSVSTVSGKDVCSGGLSDTVYVVFALIGIIIMSCYFILYPLKKIMKTKIILSLFIFGSIVSGAMLLIIEGEYLIVGLMCIYVTFIGACVQLITNAIVDLFPTNIRGMAVCLAILSGRIGSITANQLSGILIDSQCSTILWVLIGALAVCIVINLLVPSKANYVAEKHEEDQQN